MVKRISLFLLSLACLRIGALPAASQIRYFQSIQEVKADYVRQMTNNGKDRMDMSKLQIKEVDLNGDGKIDYWLLNPEFQCGSGGCWGSVYLWTPKGYCEGSPVKEDEIARKKLPPNKCTH